MLPDLPRHLSTVETSLWNRLERDGYAVLPGFAAGLTTEVAARFIGCPIIPWGMTGIVQNLSPRAMATPNTYSGLFGFGLFPYHTDLAHRRVPPRYLMLRCVRGYDDVPTLLVDGHAIVTEIGSGTIERALVKARRPQLGELRLMRLQQTIDGDRLLRWDQTYLRSASQIGEYAIARVQAALELATPVQVSMTEEGDVLVIDNWRMLHARPPVPEGRRDRKLERVYLGKLI